MNTDDELFDLGELIQARLSDDGSLFTDEQIAAFITIAICYINEQPPFTCFNIDDEKFIGALTLPSFANHDESGLSLE